MQHVHTGISAKMKTDDGGFPYGCDEEDATRRLDRASSFSLAFPSISLD